MAFNMVAGNSLIQAPITYLYPGMEVPGDIYGADARHLLIPAGTVLDAALIDKIKEINWQSYVYVSESTYQGLSDGAENYKPLITVNQRLEQETGYADIRVNTDGLLKKITAAGAVPKEEIYTISEEMSHRLKVTKRDVVLELINGMASADEYLPRHVINVGMLNGLIGCWLGMPQSEIDLLILIGLLHDCGKTVIPPDILNAPRRLLTIEFEVMKMHTVYGYKMLSEFPANIRDGALYHHEKANGNGYPKCRSGDDIPLSARITSVSDIYDAMVSRRVYKEPVTPFSVLATISELKATALDVWLVDTFIVNMLETLKGKRVLLSNGEAGIVKEIDPEDMKNPLIELNGQTFKCDENLFCIAMC